MTETEWEVLALLIILGCGGVIARFVWALAEPLYTLPLSKTESGRDVLEKQCEEMHQEIDALKETLRNSHHAGCNLWMRRVGDCNCEAEMKGEIATLKERLAALSALVSDAEWEKFHGWLTVETDDEDGTTSEYETMSREGVNYLIKARMEDSDV